MMMRDLGWSASLAPLDGVVRRRGRPSIATRPPNRTEHALGLPLRSEAEAATASSPTLRPRREVLPPSESTHARDHATFSEDPMRPDLRQPRFSLIVCQDPLDDPSR